MKKILRPALLSALLLTLLSAGCSPLRLWEEKAKASPAIAFAAMEVQGIKGLETIFRLDLRVSNPNDGPLKLRGLSCELKISGKLFADGSGDEQITVPAFGSAAVPVQVRTSEFDLAGAVIEQLQRKEAQPDKPLQYELSGRLRTGDKGEDSVPFMLKGSLPLGI